MNSLCEVTPHGQHFHDGSSSLESVTRASCSHLSARAARRPSLQTSKILLKSGWDGEYFHLFFSPNFPELHKMNGTATLAADITTGTEQELDELGPQKLVHSTEQHSNGLHVLGARQCISSH